MRTTEDIKKLIEQEDVEFIRLQFTDIFGNLKNLAVTPSQLDKVLAGRYVVDGSVLFDNAVPFEQDIYLRPDLDTFVILPWRPQQGKVGKFLCDICYEDGHEFELSPRTILKKVLKEAQEKGYSFLVKPECEFFLFHIDDNGMPTTVTHEKAGYMDVGPADFGENARRDMVLNLEEMGFEIESSLHEKAPAQHEIAIKEADPMRIADSIMTFKFAVRSIAKRFGLYATFMPKPKTEEAGSGLHFSISLDKKDFAEQDKLEKYFLGGIMAHSEAICAITNPLVNSYKRLMANVKWIKKLARVHQFSQDEAQVELRFPDPSANPYLALAVCILAGMEGVEKKSLPTNEVCLPQNLKEAVEQMKKDDLMKQVLGERFIQIFTDMKTEEWVDYLGQVSDWEVRKYLYKW